jgi:hypothetical protein
MELEARASGEAMRVLNDPAALRGLLSDYSEMLIAARAETAKLMPKVEALDKLAQAGEVNLVALNR